MVKVFWACECGNVNKYEETSHLFFTSEKTSQLVGFDECVKCQKRNEFTLRLEIKPQ